MAPASGRADLSAMALALFDTNVLIRHLTRDPPETGRAATRFLAENHDLILTDVVVAETVYVLESYYERPRDEVATAVRALLALPAVHVSDEELLHRAAELYEGERLDFAEAYLAAAAERWGIDAVASFDRSLDRVPSVRRVEPGRHR